MANVRVVVVDVVWAGTGRTGINQYRIVDATGISYLTNPTPSVSEPTRRLGAGVMVDLELNDNNVVTAVGHPIDIPRFNPKGDV